MQPLNGFRDFYPDDCARRNYILSRWREVARRYGFVEYDGPTAEPLALYEKKSGGELVGQLFTVSALADPAGGAKGALRPEMTPTLARMVAAHHRDYPKPMKWFSTPLCFRHERPQEGRLREFYQLNCDIIGEASAAADAEMIAVAIDTLRAFGFGAEDFVVRLSDREAWAAFASARGVPGEKLGDLLAIVDKLERSQPEQIAAQLEPLGLQLADVQAFLAEPRSEATKLVEIEQNLRARGMGEYVEFDLTIVRGLAYYTGTVFEIFDRAKKKRALAGGGRYDGLLALMSDGKANLPALGFGMGDVVLAKLIDATPAAKAQMDAWAAAQKALDVYIGIAKEERRPEALGLVQSLRDFGRRVDFPLNATKVGKQFQAAEALGARTVVLVGEEWPEVKLKNLATREERLVPAEQLHQLLTTLQS